MERHVSGETYRYPSKVSSSSTQNNYFNNAINQGNILNPLFWVGKHSKNEVKGGKDFLIKAGDIEIHCPNHDGNPIGINEKKLLISLINKYLLYPDDKSFEYPVDTFRRLLGYIYTEYNMKECSKKLRKSIGILENCYIAVTTKAIKNSKKENDTWILKDKEIHFLTDVRRNKNKTIAIRRGNASFSFTEEFKKYLGMAHKAYLPDEMMDITDPIAFYICYELSIYCRICLNKSYMKTEEFRISVKKLITRCQDIPEYQHVRENMGGKVYDKIIKPFFRALSGIQSFVIKVYHDEKEIEYGNYEGLKGLNIENLFEMDIVYSLKENPYLGLKKRVR